MDSVVFFSDTAGRRFGRLSRFAPRVLLLLSFLSAGGGCVAGLEPAQRAPERGTEVLQQPTAPCPHSASSIDAVRGRVIYSIGGLMRRNRAQSARAASVRAAARDGTWAAAVFGCMDDPRGVSQPCARARLSVRPDREKIGRGGGWWVLLGGSLRREGLAKRRVVWYECPVRGTGPRGPLPAARTFAPAPSSVQIGA